MSYLDASATEALLEEGVAEKKAAKKKPIALKIMSYFLWLVSSAPLLCFMLIRNKRIAITVGTGAALFSFCVNGIYYKLGGTKSWPKVLDVSSLTTFGIVTILVWSFPKEMDHNFLFSYLDVWIFGGFVVDISIAWGCFGVRFTEQYTKDTYSEEELSHPSTDWGLRVMTIVYLVAFAALAGFGVAIGVFTMNGNITWALALRPIQWSTFGVFTSLMQYVIVPKYMKSKRFQKMLTEKYPDELAAWEAAHPDHPLAQM